MLAAIAIASAVVLFSPDPVITFFGLKEVRNTHRAWLGGTLLLSSLLFVSAAVGSVAKLLGPALISKWNARQLQKELHYLSPPEAAILAEYLAAGTTTRSFAISDGIVGGLVGKKILYCASNVGHAGSISFDYNLQPWAWRYLVRHPELVRQPEHSSPSDV